MKSHFARLIAALLVIAPLAACHSIERGVYAHAPVPLSVLPLREPIRFTVGPSTGQAVPMQHGLLGSYFNGAAYAQSAYNEYLDHQQIDPNVDFAWDASDTNPVIPAGHGGIDVSEGDPYLPDHWPIFSIVWEGYLEAPVAGTYSFRLHVNNGGWLEMKGAAGSLETVISCPGGSGFEGDCPNASQAPATRDLAAGRHYVRISYYNNAPSVADAIFSWQKPGDSGLSVVPTESLWTQAASDTVKRGIIFVHGIKGNFTTPGFEKLLVPLGARYKAADGSPALRAFNYHQDIGNIGSVRNGICTDRPLTDILPFNDRVGYPVDLPHIGEPDVCDSNDDIGVNGLFLEHDVRFFRDLWQVDKITIVSNSMGGAIVRAYLAYAMATRDDPARRDPAKADTLQYVDAVIFVQGVQQGAYPLKIKEFFDEHPVLQPVREGLAKEIRERSGIDPDRPAATDLAPRSEMINYVNQLDHVPRTPHYANVRSDIRLHPVDLVFGWSFPFPSDVSVGDYLLLPGDNDPTHTPDLGGAGILPSTIAAGSSSGQWTLRRDDRVVVNPPLFPFQVPFLIGAPETHFQVGAQMDKICVRTLRGKSRLDTALLDLIASLDTTRPDLTLLDFGDLPNTRCD